MEHLNECRIFQEKLKTPERSKNKCIKDGNNVESIAQMGANRAFKDLLKQIEEF